jgi:hypothetical protein
MITVFNPAKIKHTEPEFVFVVGNIGTTIFYTGIADALKTSDKIFVTWGNGDISASTNVYHQKTYVSPFLYPVQKNETWNGRYSSWRRATTFRSIGSNTSTNRNRFLSIDFTKLRDLSWVQLSNINDLTTLDFSTLKGLWGTINLQNIALLNQLLFGEYTGFYKPLDNVRIDTVGLTNLDLSKLRNLVGSVSIMSNPNLQTIIFPLLPDDNCSQMTSFNVYSNPVLTALDLTNLWNISQRISIYNNNTLQTINFPIELKNNQPLNFLQIYSNQSLINLDLSIFDKIETRFQINSNNNLETITFSENLINTAPITIFQIYSLPKLISLNLSRFNKLGENINLSQNTILQNLIFPEQLDIDAPNITILSLHQNTALTELNLQALTKLGGIIYLYSLTNLENLTLPNFIETTAENITQFYFYSNPKITNVDFSIFKKLGGIIRLYGNTTLNEIIFPEILDSTSSNITELTIGTSPELLSLDLRCFTKLGGTFTLNNLSKLNSVQLPNTLISTTENFSNITFVNLTLLGGSLNFTPFIKLGGILRVYNNPLIQNILLPATLHANSALFTAVEIYNNPTLNSLDLSSLTKIGGGVVVKDNINMVECIFPQQLSTANGITFEFLNNNEIVNLNISGLQKIGQSYGNIRINNNNKLETITHTGIFFTPTSSLRIDYFNVDDNPKLKTLNIPSINNLARYLYLRNNPELETVVFNSQMHQQAYANLQMFIQNNNLLEYLDISGIRNLSSNSFSINNNNKLKTIIFPIITSTARLNELRLENNDLTGTLDISGLTNLAPTNSYNNFTLFSNNPNLTKIIWPVLTTTTGGAFGYIIKANNCSLDADTIEDFLLKMRNYYLNVNPSGGVSLQFQGGNNAGLTTQAQQYLDEIITRFSNFGYNLTWNFNDPINILIQTTGSRIHLRVGNNILVEDEGVWNFGDNTESSTINTTFTKNYSGDFVRPATKNINFNSKVKKNVNVFYCYGDSTSIENRTYINFIDFSNILSLTDFRMYNVYDLTSINLGHLIELSGTLQIYNNQHLNEIILPTSISQNSPILTNLLIHSNAIQNLNLSAFNTLSGILSIYSNSLLETLVLPTTLKAETTNITSLNINNNPLLETLDLSAFTKLGTNISAGGTIDLSNNQNLQTLILPANVTGFDIGTFRLNNNKLSTLDLSMFTRLRGTIDLNNMSEVTSITFPNNTDASNGSVAALRMDNCPKLINIDISNLKSIGGGANTYIYAYGNLLLETFTYTGINLDSTELDNFYIYDCPEITSINITGLTNLGRRIRIYNNPKLTNLQFTTNPSSSTLSMLELNIYSTGIIGTLNLSTFKMIAGSLKIYNNPGLTNISIPTQNTSNRFSAHIEFQNNNLQTLNLSNLTNMTVNTGVNFNISNNLNLTEIIFPNVTNGSNSNPIYGETINLQNCSLTQSTLDNLIQKIRNYYGTFIPTRNVNLQMQGGLNESPSAQSIVMLNELVSIFSTNSRTFTYSHN